MLLTITSPFGTRIHPVTGEERRHNGIDLRLPHGTVLLPAAPGRVTRTWHDDPINGHAIRIDHGGGLGTSYVHLSQVFVRVGDQVDRRTPIGLSGGTPGTPGAGLSTGPHLHFVVWEDGRAVDPVPRVAWADYGVSLAYK